MSTQLANIGRYEVVRRLAQGGMGALYLAWDPRLDRQIAIKLLMHDDDDLRERFAREARSVARLRHPHIVTIFDVGEHEDRPFIAMEYVQGQTLAAMVKARTELSVPQKLKLAEELCDGLGFAHKAGVIHRDVKPANAIVDAQGAIKILDFGIARVGDSHGMTQAGMLMGTLNYMSPEQMQGQPIDSRSDIFAVGAVAYELLAYRQAFPGGLETGVITRIIQANPEPLERICDGLDSDVVRIVNRALARDPIDRYQDLGQMGQELQRARVRLDRNPQADVIVAVPTPTPTPSTGGQRRAADRDELARRRLQQVQAHLDAAGQALASGDADTAVGRCEEALVLDGDHPGALALFERARSAQDERQADTLLGDAEAHIRLGALTAAQVLIERAGVLCATLPRVTSLRRTVDDALRDREQTRRRTESVARLLDRANGAFDWGDFDGAIKAADEALAEHAGLPEALALRQRARSALDAREQAQAVRDDASGDERTVLMAPPIVPVVPVETAAAQAPAGPPLSRQPAAYASRLAQRPNAKRLRVRPVWLYACSGLVVMAALLLFLAFRPDAPPPVDPRVQQEAARTETVRQRRVEARQFLAAGALPQAVQAIANGLAVRPDAELSAIADEVLAAVAARVESARREAVPFAGSRPPREFTQADARRAAFATLRATGNAPDAVAAGLDAAVRFTTFADARRTGEERRLAQEKRAREEQIRLEEAERERVSIEAQRAEREAIAQRAAEAQAKREADALARAAEERAKREAEEQARRDEQDRLDRAAAAAETARLTRIEDERRAEDERTARAAAAREGERRSLDAVVQAYVQGYSDRNAAAVKRVFPSTDERQLAERFAALRSQRVTVGTPAVEIDGQAATVAGQWVVESVDMFGQRQKASIAFRLRLQKSGDAWVIVSRQ